MYTEENDITVLLCL